jgi:hypothetical protein
MPTVLRTKAVSQGFKVSAHFGCDRVDGIPSVGTADKTVSTWTETRDGVQDAKDRLLEKAP